MSDLDNAINSINASAAKAENTATFLDDMSTFDDQSSVTNPNNGQTVASIPKQVKDRTDELFTAAESDINQAVADAEQSATDAQDAADSIGRYQGLWPDTGGIAEKGDTYQTQVSGTPTGLYFTALQSTTVEPVGDDVNWREIVNFNQIGTVSVRYFGAFGEGGDETTELQNALSSGLSIEFEDKDYIVSGKLTKTNTAHVSWGNCTINGSGITDANLDSVLSIEGDDTLTQLPDLSGDLEFADRNVAFSSSHGLNVGDWFVVYDPRDYSYSPARVGYKAGEFMQVQQVASLTEVVISGTVFSKVGYDALECEVYKVTKSQFSFGGTLTVKTPTLNSSIRAISLSHAIDTDISNFRGIANGGIIGIVLSQCINISGNGVVGQQSGNIAVDYGVAVVSSQHINLNGRFTARRHGFTTAEQAYGEVGVVCRDIHVDGYFSSYDPDLASADTHGNTEYLTFTGTIDGGVNLRGNHLACHARVFADESGRCVQFSELVGYDMDISGSYLYGSKLDSAWGIISSGYTGTTATPDYEETVGGLLNMKNVTIDAPNASLLISILKKASLAEDVKVDLRGLNIVNSQNFPSITFTDSTASGKFEYVNLMGVDGVGSEINLTHTRLSKVIAKVSGIESVTTDGDTRAQSTVDLGISFGFEYTPKIFTSLATSGNAPTSGGSTFIIPYGVPTGSSNSQAFVGFGSSDNSNMTSGFARDVNWIAE